MPTPTKIAPTQASGVDEDKGAEMNTIQSEPKLSQTAARETTDKKRLYRLKRGIWSVIDDETGERLTYTAGELIELTAEEYERNKRNLIVV